MSQLTHEIVDRIQTDISVPYELLSTVSCHLGFSIEYLTAWHLASSESASKKARKSASKTKDVSKREDMIFCNVITEMTFQHFTIFYQLKASYQVHATPKGNGYQELEIIGSHVEASYHSVLKHHISVKFCEIFLMQLFEDSDALQLEKYI